jgi:hypothetical protein
MTEYIAIIVLALSLGVFRIGWVQEPGTKLLFTQNLEVSREDTAQLRVRLRFVFRLGS